MRKFILMAGLVTLLLGGCGGSSASSGSSSSGSSSSPAASTPSSSSTFISDTAGFHPNDRYDCFAYQAITHIDVYVDSYQFHPDGTYAVGYRGPQLTGLSTQFGKGAYRVSGDQIISTSGWLNQLGQHFVIQRNGIALADASGHFSSLGCYDFTKHDTPASPQPASTGATFPVGQYVCFSTHENGDGSFWNSAPSHLLFWDDGTYLKSGSVRMDGWHQSGSTIIFTGGPFWYQFGHDVGSWFPSGVPLPHAQSQLADWRFTLVIHDTKIEGGEPPSREFVSNDGEFGGTSYPESFLYCKPE